MSNALIFSPCLDGHRQVYVFVIADVLEKLGYNLFVAGNLQEKISNAFYIEKLKENPAITLIDTNHYAKGGLDITLSELQSLQKNCEADLTIFTEADFHIPLFVSQVLKKSNRLKGKTVGIFMRPFYFYKPNPFLDKLRFIKNIADRWNRDEKVFFSFYLKKFSLLDVSLSIDENFVRNNPHFHWLPDIFQQYADTIVPPDEKSEQRIWIEKLKTFKESNPNRFMFLYFGTAQLRRGYGTLLRLAKETGGCFIHCGLRDEKVESDLDTTENRSALLNEGRLFETNEFIEDPSCIEFFFKSVSHLILPYYNFLGSSGVMLQALEYGIPVLAPDSAIIGYRIKKNNLGMTYTDNNFDSLMDQFVAFKKTDPVVYQEHITTYMKMQSPDQLKNALINSFIDSNKPVLLP